MRNTQKELPAIETGSSSSSHDPRGAWREAAVAFSLSLLFPGAGHVYVSSLARGCLWSLSFLTLALPGAILLYIGLSAPGSGVLLGVGAFLLTFVLLCAVGPVRTVLWGRKDEKVRKRPSLWLIEGYAALVALGATMEVKGFLEDSFVQQTVESNCLAPFASRGETVTVLLSRFVRPVHGDLLYARRAAQASRGDTDAPGFPDDDARLGLVLARGGDTIRSAQGKLLVNGVELDLRRIDQRFEIERAGLAERRRRIFATIRMADRLRGEGPREPPAGALGGGLEWGAADWGPFLVPRRLTLVLPDEGDCARDGTTHRGAFVQKTDILGRAID